MERLLHCADCLTWIRAQPNDSVDLIFGSPPYEDARLYNMDFKLNGQAWVDWMVMRWLEFDRVCRGLVCMVVEGRTKKFGYTATPALLMADLHRAGIKLRKPPVYHRVGIPGSGGPDWWRNDYEWCVCSSKGRMDWANPIATGAPCKYKTGGAMSYRTQDGRRWNAKTGKRLRGNNGRPEVANPGNVLRCVVGGGRMGSDLAHENEAPFPESLVEPFVLCFCPPGGTVLDPFCGSGTTGAVALRHGRKFVGIDIRESQVALTHRRLAEIQREIV